MLSDYQADMVWKGMLGAEIRSTYFATLSQRLQRMQRQLTLGSLILSSGAGVIFIQKTFSTPHYGWIAPMLSFLSAGLGLWSLVAKNERGSIDAADLHSRWASLALGYESIWQNVAREDAAIRLAELQTREVELSKSSTAFPDDGRLMEQSQKFVEMNRSPREIPA